MSMTWWMVVPCLRTLTGNRPRVEVTLVFLLWCIPRLLTARGAMVTRNQVETCCTPGGERWYYPGSSLMHPLFLLV